MLRALLTVLRQAGAKREADTDRDGALSYHAESHAVAVGAGLGFAALATGNKRLIGAVVGLAVYGRRGETKLGGKLIDDVRSEPHYALGGLVAGGLLGVFARMFA